MLEDVLNHSTDSICLEIDNKLIFANVSFRQLFSSFNGHSTRDHLDFLDIVAPGSKPEVAAMLQCVRDGITDSIHYEFCGLTNQQNEIRLKAISQTLSINGNHGILTTLKRLPDTTDTPMDKVSHNLKVVIEKVNETPFDDDLEYQDLLKRVLENASHIVPSDASQIMLISDDNETVRILAVHGYENRSVQVWHENLTLRIDTTFTLKSMYIDGNPIAISDTHKDPRWIINDETRWIRSYAGAPIRVRGKVIGFLNLNSELPGFFTAKMANRLQAFADQAGLAIYNAKLVHELRSSHHALKEAYDNTLLGWSKALELRDNETEGHTLRVVGKTLQLAIMFGIREPDLTYIRFGAMLHDIGKIAIPDSILMKEGPLTEEEWRIMRQHPDFARQILSPIPYLVPAIDIPYAHHERWDGTGYPRGLKGLEIPFSARIFMVVDVYDGLRSDRRYRSGWDDAKVIQYIRSQSGLHFDPEVVDAFMKMDLHS